MCAAVVEYFFRSEYNLFVPCPNQMNAFNVIVNVIEQIDIYQHYKYRTISVLNLNLKNNSKLTWKFFK